MSRNLPGRILELLPNSDVALQYVERYNNNGLLTVLYRQLFETSLRNSIRQIDGLLPDPDLYTQWADRHHILGKLLVEQVRDAGQSFAGRHYRVDDDYAHVINQRRSPQNIVRQVHRRVLGNVFRNGFRFAIG